MKGTIYLDFDGTLHNTSKIYAKALNKGLKEMASKGWIDFSEVEEDEVKKYLGCTKKEMWNHFLPNLEEEKKKAGSQWVAQGLLEELNGPKEYLYPNVLESLEKIKDLGYTLVFLSNCSIEYMDKVKEKYQLQVFFTDFLCEGAFPGCSKGEIITYNKDKYPKGYAMVGDRHHDMEGAKEHSLLPIFCTYGFGEKGEGEGCISISSFEEILDHI
ncbi:MAG: HAD hydrolase-like protein [Tissierellia bacterium]|nr:HAD hydrolase-like protein [Tissierellia bacterium]